MKTFLDSSAFAKRFVEEVGSEEVEDICAGTTELAVSIICTPEIISALNRRVREKALSRTQYSIIKERLAGDLRDAVVVNLTSEILQQGISLLESNALRAMDALHIASALVWRADQFVSADVRQVAAARKAGMKTRMIGK
jgi:predicted nucleic acid-binding protein